MSHYRRPCESNIYHVMSRGVSRQVIFEDDFDRRSLYRLIAREAAGLQVKLHAWCFMSNHVHLLVNADLAVISSFMQRVQSPYALEFNERHGRVGHLFQGRFKSEAIEGDRHFLAAVRYVHQNPQKAGVAPTSAYRWSSYAEYVGTPRITDTALALDLLGSRDGFIRFHEADGRDCFLDEDDDRGEVAAKRALRIALDELGADGLHAVGSLTESSRRDAVRRLSARGLTIRQIERVTGISRGAIARLLK